MAPRHILSLLLLLGLAALALAAFGISGEPQDPGAPSARFLVLGDDPLARAEQAARVVDRVEQGELEPHGGLDVAEREVRARERLADPRVTRLEGESLGPEVARLGPSFELGPRDPERFERERVPSRGLAPGVQRRFGVVAPVELDEPAHETDARGHVSRLVVDECAQPFERLRADEPISNRRLVVTNHSREHRGAERMPRHARVWVIRDHLSEATQAGAGGGRRGTDATVEQQRACTARRHIDVSLQLYLWFRVDSGRGRLKGGGRKECGRN